MDLAPGASATQLSSLLAAGRVSSEQVVHHCLQRIGELDALFGVVRVLAPDALEQARASDARRRAGRSLSLLDGVPVVVKDNVDVAGLPTTAGALALEGRTPAVDAHLVGLLRQAGLVILGKVNLTELANFMTVGMPSGYSSIGGQVLNPYDLALTPSGSSSGSAGAVALGYVPLAVGTETDGSITSPAFHQSVVGLKPTLGRVSRQGVVPISPSQDTAGPMAATVRDVAALFHLILGTDPADPCTLDPRSARSVPTGAQSGAVGLAEVRLAWVDPDSVEMTAEVGTDRTSLVERFAVLEGELAGRGATLKRWRAPKDTREDELVVLVHEFAPAFDAYLARPVMAEHPVATMAELAAWNCAHGSEALKYGQQRVEAALAVDHRAEHDRYLDARRRDLERSSSALEEAIEDADAVVFPGVAGATWAARSGWPCVALPAGYCERTRRPQGVTVVARPWDDFRLLEVAAALETIPAPRRPPWEINPAPFRALSGPHRGECPTEPR